jgi:diaminopimelate decarboxylase
MFSSSQLELFRSHETPFYYYDFSVLDRTITTIQKATLPAYHIHYALKANAHPELLKHIKNAGFGADCVSGNEIKRALECGFKSDAIVFAGVGKSDKEINYALEKNIFCFNVESIPELNVINDLAKKQNVKANIALRINPNVDAHTHRYITTGL